MNAMVTRLCLCIGISAILLSSFLSAEQKKESSFEGKVKNLEIELGITSPPEKTVFSVFGDFLYWKASLDGVAYATTAKFVPAPGGAVFDDYETRTVHFDYSPAFQIGAGVALPYDQWDVSARWLRSYSTGTDHVRGDLTVAFGNRVIFDSIGILEGLDSPPSKASARCRLKFDLVDVTLGRSFLWSRYFSFRPFAGVRGAWIRLDWDIAFKMPFTFPSLNSQASTTLDVHNHYYAAGLVGGFDSKWNLYKGFGIFSFATASLLYGESSESTKQKFIQVPPLSLIEFPQTLKASNSTHPVKAAYDIAVGIKWEKTFHKNWNLLLRAGYEFFFWPNVTQKTINQQQRTRDRADLSFQGLIAGAVFEF